MVRAPDSWWHVRPAGFPVLDAALAALLAAVAVLSTITGQPDEGPLAITLPSAVVFGVSLAWRRRMPLLTVLACAAANLFQSLLAQTPGSLWSLVVLAVAMYSVAAWSTEAVAAGGGAALLASLLVGEWLVRGPDYLFIVLVMGGIWLLGRAARIWRARLAAQQRHEHESAQLAVTKERLRIARELHDVLGHSMGVIAVQADAAGAVLAENPELAQEPLRAIHATARGSLAEIRAMLELLRGEDDVESAAPGLAQLEKLLEGSAMAGLPVNRRISAALPATDAATELAIYRVVQESLTNVMKHAGSVATAVSVRPDACGVRVEIANGPGAAASPGLSQTGAVHGSVPGSVDGYGLRGLGERLGLVGGTLHAGPTDDGGWLVSAHVPAQTDQQEGGAP